MSIDDDIAAMLFGAAIVLVLAVALAACSSDPRDVPVAGPQNLNTHCSTGQGRVVKDSEGWFVECPPFGKKG